VSDALEQLEEQEPAPPTRRWPAVATLVVVLVEAGVLGYAAWSSGSAVLFAEAAQSVAGAAVEIFLLVGVRRSQRPPSEAHPLGHGREAFFWSLIASVGVFVGGGAVSIAYGISAFRSPSRGEEYLLGYVVLAIIVVADGWTLAAAIHPLLRSPIVRRIGFRRGLRQTSDAGARTLIFDNAAAVLGGLIGIGGLAIHQVTGDPRFDAIASLVIGALLFATTVALLHANRELLTDRSIAREVVAAMRDRITALDGITAVPDLLAVYTGPNAVLVTGTVVLEADLDVPGVERVLAAAGEALAGRFPGELRVYLSPVPRADAS
jgi:cation diffusion facilitator family transporter